MKIPSGTFSPSRSYDTSLGCGFLGARVPLEQAHVRCITISIAGTINAGRTIDAQHRRTATSRAQSPTQEEDAHDLDHANACRNLHRARDQRLSAGRVLIPSISILLRWRMLGVRRRSLFLESSLISESSPRPCEERCRPSNPVPARVRLLCGASDRPDQLRAGPNIECALTIQRKELQIKKPH
jgi:hypothetical protein